MPIEPPPTGHRLEGPVNRFAWHVKRAEKFAVAVMPSVQAQGDPAIQQYLFQALVLMIHSHMEDFFTRVVSLGGITRPAELRAHIAKHYPAEIVLAETEPIFKLADVAADREVSFRDDAVRLKRVFRCLFDREPFADPGAEAECLDLVVVRNVITHDGAWPREGARDRVRRKDVILESGRVGDGTFYKLEIPVAFIVDTLSALARSAGPSTRT